MINVIILSDILKCFYQKTQTIAGAGSRADVRTRAQYRDSIGQTVYRLIKALPIESNNESNECDVQ